MQEPDPRAGSPYVVLTTLTLAYVLNFVDRQVLAIVALDVKQELGLSDTQLGLLLGPAFAVCFTLSGFVLARIADVSSRRAVLATGVAVWSLLTAACGIARSYTTLAFLRFGVGIGEAAGTPPSHSLISDYFPPERRARAFSIYGLGIYFGTAFGFAGGGLVAQYFDWRTAFLAAGLAGLPLALWIAIGVREPKRQGAHVEAPPLRAVLPAIFATPTFRWLMVAASCQAFVGYAVLSWGAPFLRRVFGLTAGEAGVAFGLIAGVTGALGALIGGTLVDRLAQRDARWYAWLSAVVSLAAFPACAVFVLARDVALSLAAFGVFYLINNAYLGSLWTLVQGLVAPRLRATASATQLAITNLIGYGVGPALVGWMNDALASRYGDDAIRWSLLLCACVGALSALFFWRCARSVREDLAAVAAGA
ncbi:MAG TPA: MFS transporter [Myxococcota bacterium]|jgi:predicted MFS family arabinose efflux permease|nr:MFS transporter [Myxococcota bacterium]